MMQHFWQKYYSGKARRHATENYSGPSEHIWSLGYALACDVSPFYDGRIPANYSTSPSAAYMNPKNYTARVKNGDLVWVAGCRVSDFVSKVLPRLKVRISLVISDGDETFPSDLKNKIDLPAFLRDERIISIFSQNYDGSCPGTKIHHLPIGLDFHTINRRGGYWGSPQKSAQEQEQELQDIAENAPAQADRIPKAFIDFHLSDRQIWDGSRRSDIYRVLKPSECVDVSPGHMARSGLWKAKSNYVFSISPHGAGLDCHRTWEDLCLGCIVIVKTSGLDAMYEGLPVVIVKDWDEISSKNLELWKQQYGNAAQSLDKLKTRFWIDKIRKNQNEYRA